MISTSRFRQVSTIARLQLRRVFFSRRSFWVYLLALFPTVIFTGHGLEVKLRREQWSSRVTPPAVLDSVREGETEEEILKRAPRPIYQHRPPGRRREQRGPGFVRERGAPSRSHLMYFDGSRRLDLFFESGILQRRRIRPLVNFDEDQSVFAAVFQYFYLRLAVFFGCLGIFMNLFRGEMLDKTLHFWFLLPVRREVLLAGKYLAGLIAATLIFTAGAMLCFGAMLWPQDSAQVELYWRENGTSHLFWYAGAAALGCLGYGSVFLAAGLLPRNPIVPAVVLLIWEGINGFLPAILQKLSVIYHLQALYPVPVPMDPNMPAWLRLLLSPPEPTSAATAILGLLAVTGLVLWSASRAVRRLEINYGTD